jgi:hypothetical protein
MPGRGECPEPASRDRLVSLQDVPTSRPGVRLRADEPHPRSELALASGLVVGFPAFDDQSSKRIDTS